MTSKWGLSTNQLMIFRLAYCKPGPKKDDQETPMPNCRACHTLPSFFESTVPFFGIHPWNGKWKFIVSRRGNWVLGILNSADWWFLRNNGSDDQQQARFADISRAFESHNFSCQVFLGVPKKCRLKYVTSSGLLRKVFIAFFLICSFTFTYVLRLYPPFSSINCL